MMFRMPHTLGRAVVVALVAGAVAVPVAQAHPGGFLGPDGPQFEALSAGGAALDPVYGLAARVSAGPALGDSPTAESVATAIGFLEQQGFSAGQIEGWTVGVCSYETKPSSCYTTPAQARLASQRTAEGFLAQNESGQPAPPAAPTVRASGFDFGDAAIGFGTAAGVALLGAGLVLTMRRRGDGGTLAGA